jgi:hypothetical protein
MVQPVTFWMNPYHGWWNYVADIFWVILVGKVGVDEVLYIMKAVRQVGLNNLRSRVNFANSIDWFLVSYTIGVSVMWYFHLQRLNKLVDYLEQANVEVTGSFSDSSTREAFFGHVEEIVQEGETRRLCIALYPFMLVPRFFKAFSAQPRLSLVTSTITTAATDLFHFGVVFACIFALYTASAMILFGSALNEFVTVGRACDNVFHILLGDFDWAEMRGVVGCNPPCGFGHSRFW